MKGNGYNRSNGFTVKLWLLIGAALVLLLSGCASRAPLKVGFIGSLSGTSSDLSVSGFRGAELALEALQDSADYRGRPIELVVWDDQNDPQKAIEAFASLQQAEVEIILGPYTSGIAMELMTSLNASESLLLSPTVSADALTGIDDGFIRFIASTKEQAHILADYVGRHTGDETIVIYDQRNKAYSEQLMKNYQQDIQKRRPHQVVEIGLDPSNADAFQGAVSKVLQQRPEYLLLLCGAEDTARFAQAIKPHQSEIQLMAPLWANTPQLIKKGGRYVDGTVVVSGIDPVMTTQMAAFAEQYTSQYGEPPTFASVYTYEAVMALKDALQTREVMERESVGAHVKSELLKKGTFEGLQGTFQIDSNGDNMRPYYLYQIVEGELRKAD